MVLLLKTVDN